MLGGSEEDASKRRPFEFLTNMFKRRRDHDAPEEDPAHHHMTLQEPEELSESWTKNQVMYARGEVGVQEVTSSSEVVASSENLTSSDSVTSSTEGGFSGSAAILHHTPVKSRDIGVDMEAIRLSRQDNPYLQRVAGSQATLNEEEEVGDAVTSSQPEDRAHLVSQPSGVNQEGPLTLSEVHEHLIRSPPPTSLPKSLGRNVFVFPTSKTLDSSSTQRIGSPPGRANSLNPLVTRGHEDVLDHHLRQILNTQRQLAVTRTKSGEAGGLTCSSVPGSPAHARNVARRSPHARTLSEETTIVQPVGGSSTSGGSATVVGVTLGVGVGVAGSTSSNSGSLAPVLPPGRRQHSPSDLLLHPAQPPTNSSTSTPPVLKPISTRTRRKLPLSGEEIIPGLALGANMPTFRGARHHLLCRVLK